MVEKIKKIFHYNREKYENIFEDENSVLWIYFDKFITFLLISFIIVITFESIWNNREIYYLEILFFEAFISVVFAIEYMYRFFRAENKLKFFISPLRIIDLLSFLPFFVWLVFIWEFVNVLKLIRVLRILKFIRKVPLTRSFLKSLKDFSMEYKAVFMLFLILLFLGSLSVYYVEKDVIWTKFTSIPISLRWGLVTMATVWYWDIYPTTTIWKIFWSVIVFFWPILLALLSAVTIMVFTEANNNQKIVLLNKRWKTCIRCKTKNYVEANYCYTCWEKLV